MGVVKSFIRLRRLLFEDDDIVSDNDVETFILRAFQLANTNSFKSILGSIFLIGFNISIAF